MNSCCLPEQIKTSRMLLRKHSLEVGEAMFRCVDRDRDRLRRFLPWVDATTKVEDELNYLRTAIENWLLRREFDYGMFEGTSGEFMGNIGVHSIAWEHDRCELGYWISAEFEGKGYVTEAVRGLEQACFSAGFHRIEIRCSSQNERSAAVPKRAGYDFEAILHEDRREHGDYIDTLVFAKVNRRGLNPS